MRLATLRFLRTLIINHYSGFNSQVVSFVHKFYTALTTKNLGGVSMLTKKICTVLALLLLSSATSWAALNGDIEGIVKDGTGALIPSAMVMIVSVETGAQRM